MKRRRKYTKGNKHFRKALNELAEDIYRLTPLIPASGWEETPSGLRYHDKASEDFTPHFSPIFTPGSSPTLGITWGWLNAPKAAAVDHEIPDYDLHPYMPEINLVDLNDSSPNVLTLTKSATNLTYLEITLTERSAVMGATTANAGTTGMTVWTVANSTGVTVNNNSAPPDVHNHGITDPTHDHESQLDLQQLGYHIDETVQPQFKVTTASVVPVNSLLVRRIPWGKHILDSNGEATSTPEWYWLGDRDFTPNSWIRSNVSSGHGGANDLAVNPVVA